MKRFLIAATLVTAAIATPTFAADVGVSVSIGQPGFYGRLDIGGYPPPQVIYRQPMVVQQVSRDRPPIYLRVPASQTKHWEKHCRKYNACGERVYFVKDNWYRHDYVPYYQNQQRNHHDNGHDERRDDHRDNGNSDHHGNGKQQGRDH
ncbi:hypothetical protein [Sulfuriferula nivalis]|uniref:Lipoprotein n=1 Tax=Sulfuriferula nivalis TaxID=2675298 RepID=A0A809RL29_9PROT|nr:hypothetical protein [Sulfuriferula nivalis]BBP01514.1 hypothetical protein SFSGTM_22220 [Sulfuriferula nivalis]